MAFGSLGVTDGEGGVVGRGALSTTRQVLEKRGVAGKDDDGSPLDK